MRFPFLPLIPIILITAASTPSATAATLHVPADYPTIQSCIDSAVSGQDECVVAPGTYNELINFLGKAITLRSSHGREVTTIIAGDAHSYNFIASSNSFDGIHLLSLSFVDVKSENIGKLTMKDCTVIDSTFRHLGSQMWMNGCTVVNSTFSHSGSLWIMDSNFQSSSVSADLGTLNIQDCVFQGSSAGAIENYRAFLTIERCMFLGNRGLFSGGAIRYFDSTEHPASRLVARSNVFVGNSAPRGGAFVYSFHLSERASNGTSTFTENQSDQGGSVVSLGSVSKQ